MLFKKAMSEKKKIQCSEAEVAANVDITPKLFLFKDLLGIRLRLEYSK